ncbi:MAG: riboflavin biosynthesis protein RibF [Asticcacaulis sp.]
MFFDPHPHSFFRPDDPPFRLSRIQQQMQMFEGLEMDYAVIVKFDANLSRMSPEDFARKVLKEALGVAFVGCGFDFNFGARGAGKAEDLKIYGEKYGFEVAVLPCQTGQDGEKLSSTAVREALRAGDLAAAEAILGQPWIVLGEVTDGARLGRTIGFPTLNIELGPYVRPKYGIYVTETKLNGGPWIRGVSNIGIRPTVGGEVELLETYLFDFDEQVYGAFAETALLHYIRPEARFDDLDALKAEIARDVEKAKAWFVANR